MTSSEAYHATVRRSPLTTVRRLLKSWRDAAGKLSAMASILWPCVVAARPAHSPSLDLGVGWLPPTRSFLHPPPPRFDAYSRCEHRNNATQMPGCCDSGDDYQPSAASAMAALTEDASEQFGTVRRPAECERIAYYAAPLAREKAAVERFVLFHVDKSTLVSNLPGHDSVTNVTHPGARRDDTARWVIRTPQISRIPA